MQLKPLALVWLRSEVNGDAKVNDDAIVHYHPGEGERVDVAPPTNGDSSSSLGCCLDASGVRL